MRGSSAAAIAMALVAVVGPASVAHQLETLADVQGRIQYAVYTQDARGLQASRIDLEALAGDEDHAALASYYLAHIEFRLAQLSIDTNPDAAAGDLDDCIERAGDALEHEPAFAEAHALIAACQGLRAELSPITGVLDSRSAASHMRKARELEAENPRIELLAAIVLYRGAPEGDPQVAAGFEQALRLFAREKVPLAGWPDWGLAEAHAYLGSVYLANGDTMRARNELEQALLIAPDYLWAAELYRRLRALSPGAT